MRERATGFRCPEVPGISDSPSSQDRNDHPVAVVGTADTNHLSAPAPAARPVEDQATLDAALDEFIDERTDMDLARLAALEPREPVPQELGRLLPTGIASDLGNHLEPNERAYSRNAAKRLAAEKTPP